MFTGLVRDLGVVVSVEQLSQGARRITLTTRLPSHDLEIGASVACNGVCLTVVAATSDGRVTFDLGPETLKRSRWGNVVPGFRVNLEPSLRMGTALGGHMVSGHIDGLAKVSAAGESESGFWRIEAQVPAPISHWLISQGSIALAGVSLTLASVGPAAPDGSRMFTVMLIPETLRQTNLSELRAGDSVEVEADQTVKTIDVLIERRLSNKNA